MANHLLEGKLVCRVMLRQGDMPGYPSRQPIKNETRSTKFKLSPGRKLSIPAVVFQSGRQRANRKKTRGTMRKFDETGACPTK